MAVPRPTATAALAAIGLAACAGLTPAAVARSVAPPRVTVHTRSPALRGGRFLIAPKRGAGAHSAHQPTGPLVLDLAGRARAFRQLPANRSALDFRRQILGGRPVYTWWQGSSPDGPGHGRGVDAIARRGLHISRVVTARNGLAADGHEFHITRKGTALITAYQVVERDLRSVGGPRDGKVLDGIVQEIDLRTHRLKYQWRALDHVPLSDSYEPLPAHPGRTPWDYFHINAVRPDADGHLLICARHTWTVYDVARSTGHVLWRLGGRHSDFRLGRGAHFSWQHDPNAESRNRIRIFDNHASTPRNVTSPSRVILLRLDRRRHTATLVRQWRQPQHRTAISQGNSQRLADGNLVVGWGSLGSFSEFSRKGRLLYDAQLRGGFDTYRAYRVGN